MSAQRITGVWLFLFTVCVVLNHALQSELSWFDVLYAVFGVPLGLSAILESKALKVIQVAIIFVTGVILVIMTEEGRPVGFVIMAFAQMYAYTYGFLATKIGVKVAGILAVYFVLFLMSLQNVASAIMWVLMCLTIHGGIWINVRHLVERSRKADELERIHLEQDLATSQKLLKETVDAGMVLVSEIREEGRRDGCN